MVVVLAGMVLGLGLGCTAFGAGVSDADVQKIRDALPDRPAAPPARPRKLLVFNLCKGFKHGSIPTAAKALQVMGEKTGAFQTVESDDPAVFAPESLKAFDAVCMNNTTGDPFDDAAFRQSLVDFVKGGKGLVGIHAATDCFYQWREYGEMMGGYFDGHPWNEAVAVKIDDPGSALTQAFGGEGFEVADEIYQFGPGKAGWDAYSRQRLHVLLSLDMTKTKDKGKRADKDYGVAWIHGCGQGRVFYCSLGHRNEIFWNPKILAFYLAGIQFALGDLEADTTPSAPAPAGEASDVGTPRILAAPAEGPSAQTAPAESEEDWTVLFDGTNLDAWQRADGGAPGAGWKIEDGALVRADKAGDLWTKSRWGDFVLDLEFKTHGNSGIFVRTDNPKDCVQTGIEVQVLDSWGKQTPDKHDCGAIYDCLAPSKTVVRENEWNRVAITCQGSHITVAMNGETITDMDLDQWTEPGKNPDGSKNKFKKALKDFKREGHIGLQDHGAYVAYRNIRVRPLGAKAE
jgi:type 1 glutamine amidotransferase